MGPPLPTQIAEALQRGDLILTPSQRAARTIRRAYDHLQQSRGETLWHPPTVLPLTTWLTTLWHTLLLEGHETRTLLNRTQELALWRQIIAQDGHPPSLGPLAAEARTQLLIHNASPQTPAFSLSPDTQAFARWSLAFDRRCHRESLLPAAALPLALHPHLPNLTIPPLTLVDFETLPPAQAALLATLPITHLQTTTQTPTHLHTAPDDQSELEAAAQWAATLLAADPQATIAIVLPNQSARRHHIDQTFAQTLAPQTQHIADPTPPPYEFSLGIPLDRTPYAATALTLLRWLAEPLPLASLSQLLTSPHLTPSPLPAAQFDAHTLRQLKLLRPELSLQAFLALNQPLPTLQHLQIPTQTTHATWAEAIRTTLTRVLLPPTDSLDYQTQSRFSATLDELATLDLITPTATYDVALAALQRIATQTIFAPESRQTPIQILGPLELGGVPFTALWFLSADDQTWPPTPTPNPLIPYHLQRTLGILGPPTPTLSAATQIIYSYSLHAEEGDRRPSPAIPPNLPPYTPTPTPPRQILAPTQIPDNLTLPPLPDQPLRGGARILELQAACPFRAFAEIRLHATSLDTRTPGLDPRDRGNLVHQVMELFWQELESQQALRDLPEPHRHTLLDQCITQALQSAARLAQTPWDHAYLQVQHQRLSALLRPWLLIELERPNFVVASHESSLRDIPLGPLRLNLRVDRIDLTAAGPLILDYKTGPAAPSQWLTPRPDLPQLPLYAVLANASPDSEPLAGVAFANLRAGEDLCLKGFADSTATLAKPSRMDAPTLADQIAEWHQTLTTLAEQFAAGDTRVDPKSYPQTCTHCTQRILCRLDPATLQSEEDDPEEQIPGVPYAL